MVAVPTVTFSAPLDDAHDAFEHRDFEKALSLLQPLADQGEAKALRMLGQMFLDGKGVLKNEQRALDWLRKAAESDDAEAAGLSLSPARSRHQVHTIVPCHPYVSSG